MAVKVHGEIQAWNEILLDAEFAHVEGVAYVLRAS